MTITNDTARPVSSGAGRRTASGVPPMAGVPSQERIGGWPGAIGGELLRELPEARSADGILDLLGAEELLQVRPGDRIRLRPDGPRGRQQTQEIPDGHPAGLHWFPAHPLAAGPVTAPVRPLVVRGEIDTVPGIAGNRERILVLDGYRPDGTLRGIQVNGQLRPEIDTQPGEVQRWRVANADPRQPLWLHIEGHSLHQIGQDGIPFGRVRPVPSILLAPGNRAEFLVRANKTGDYRVYIQHPERAGGPRSIVELATLAVSGRSIFSRLPRQLPGAPATPDVARRRALRVKAADDAGPTSVQLHHEGRALTPGRLEIELGTRAGTAEEWTLANADNTTHVVHLDGLPFQVVEVDGQPAGDPSWQTDPDIWWDTYRIPAAGQLTVRVHLRGAAFHG